MLEHRREAVLQFLRHAIARVGNNDLQPMALLLITEANGALLGMGHGIAQQMHHELIHQIGVELGLTMGRQGAAHQNRHTGTGIAHGFATIRGHELRQVHLDHRKVAHAALEIGELEQLRDEIHELTAILIDLHSLIDDIDGVDILGLFFGHLIADADHRIKGRTQRLTHIGQEHRLDALTALGARHLIVQTHEIVAPHCKKSRKHQKNKRKIKHPKHIHHITLLGF